MIKVSDYIAKRLKEVYSVDRVFMVSGGGAMHLNNSFGKYIYYTCCHHEQACAFAAEGYARVNQKLAVVNVTTGPGGLNCLNGLFGEWTDSVPVLYISGQVKFLTSKASCKELPLRQLGDQEVDIISAVKDLTKYSIMVTEPNEIKYHLDRAIFEATTGRFGPVWLDIPMNVQSAMIDEDELIGFEKPDSQIYDFNLDLVIEKLKQSERPIIVVGHGVRLSGSINKLKELLDNLNIPVVTTFNGVDLVDDSCPNFVGRIGTIGQRAANFAIQNADFALFLGTRNNVRQISYNWENFAKKAYKVVVDIDRAELDKPTLIPDLKIHSDLAQFMDAFVDAIKTLKPSLDKPCGDSENWLKWCQKRRENFAPEKTLDYKQTEKLINPYYFTRVLTSKLSEKDVLVSANATPSICIFQNGIINSRRVIMNSGDASMGYALPCAVGASYECAGNVVCFEGDGSIMMNLQELQTIKHNNLPVKIFVLNNSGYISIRQTQNNFFDGKLTGSDEVSGVTTPDFCAVAEAFGIKALRLSDASKLEETIDKVLAVNTPILCEVITAKDYTFTPKLSSKVLDDGTMVSASLEDMFPFLSAEELNKNSL